MMAWWLSAALAGPVLGDVGAADAFARCIATANAEAGLAGTTEAGERAPLPQSDKIALVVGVPCHRSDQIPSLQYSTRDAVEVGERLTASGFTVVSLLSSVDRRELFETLERVEAALSPEGTLVLYFSGHGTLREEGGALRRYLILSDTDLGMVHTTGVAVRALEERVARVAAHSRVVIQDTCFADRPTTSTERGKGLLPIEPGLQLEPGDLRLYGSRFFEQAVESVELRGSIYTVYLLEALEQKQADLDGDGCVGLLEAHTWARDKVVTERAGAQVPQVRSARLAEPGEQGGGLSLGCAQRPPQRAVLASPADEAWTIEVHDPQGQRIEGPALSPGRYRFTVSELVPTDTGELARETRLRWAMAVRAGQWVDVSRQIEHRRPRRWVEATLQGALTRSLHPLALGARAGLAPADRGRGRPLLEIGGALWPGYEPPVPPRFQDDQPIAHRALGLQGALGYAATLPMPGEGMLLAGPALSMGVLWRTTYDPLGMAPLTTTSPGAFGGLGLRGLYDAGPAVLSLEAGARLLRLGGDSGTRVNVTPALTLGVGRGL